MKRKKDQRVRGKIFQIIREIYYPSKDKRKKRMKVKKLVPEDLKRSLPVKGYRTRKF